MSGRPRAWSYDWGQYKDSPRFPWWEGLAFSLGSDEYARTTIVIPIPFWKYLVIALWNPCSVPWRNHHWLLDGKDDPSFCNRCGLDWIEFLCREVHDLDYPENNACECWAWAIDPPEEEG